MGRTSTWTPQPKPFSGPFHSMVSLRGHRRARPPLRYRTGTASGARWYDTLLVTQWTSGSFVNVGPPGVEEILQDDLKEILKPGAREEEAREIVFRELGM